MLDLEVLDDPDTAALAMEPVKARILAALATPASASCITAQVGLTRQKVTYHLRALEAHAQDVRNGTKPTMCLNGRRLEPHMARTMLDTELKRNEGVYEADMPVQLVLVNALTTVYTC